MIAGIESTGLKAMLVAEDAPLADVIARPGTRVVLLAGSRDPNAKMTLVLIDDYGPAFTVKIPTTAAAAQVVRAEGDLLTALSRLGLGSLDATLPRALGYFSAAGRPALVTTALLGAPMTVRYHAWRHTARRRRVQSDFTAAGTWLADLQRRTAGHSEQVTFLDDMLDQLYRRFPGYPGLSALRRRLAPEAARLAEFATPRTVVHGDYWLGNLLMIDDRVAGVVDWEAGVLAGEPLRDLARFAVSYSLYLDRHTRPGRRVRGHRRLRADRWGAGIAYALNGTGWFPDLVRAYVVEALERLGIAPDLWRATLLAGVAEVAATADHPEFARDHLDLLLHVENETVGAENKKDGVARE
jgi:aminoglycoside phosphotransferase (APT) family kinase protein